MMLWMLLDSRPSGSDPETGFEEIWRERNSAVPHFSQADFGPVIIVVVYRREGDFPREPKAWAHISVKRNGGRDH